MTVLTPDLADDASGASAEEMIRAAGYQHARKGDVEALRQLCAHPDAPEDFLLAVCHLPECRDVLAHRSLPPRVLEVLAEMYQYPEAVLTLGKHLYKDATTSATDFRTFLERHKENGWLLESLVHAEPSALEKEQVLLDVSGETTWSEHIRQIVKLHRDVAQAKQATDENQLRGLFRDSRPDVWLALASNPCTPADVLRQLASVSDAKFATRIRAAAQEQLQAMTRPV